MTIRVKILLAILAVFLVLVSFLATVSVHNLRTEYGQLEAAFVGRDLDRIHSAFGLMHNQLFAVAGDYATWDDTYHFIERFDSAYVRTNMEAPILQNFSINLFALLDRRASLVYGVNYDLSGGTARPIPEDLITTIAAHPAIATSSPDDSGITGTVICSQGVYACAIRPVLHSNGDGPINGFLIMGQLLDSTRIARLRRTTHIDFTLHQLSVLGTLPHLTRLLAHACSSGSAIQQVHRDSAIGYTVLNDLYKKPALVIRSPFQRTIYERGRKTTSSFIRWMTAAGIIFALMTILLLNRLVVRRLRLFSQTLNAIRTSADPSIRIPRTGHDELGVLAAHFNAMMQSLQQSQDELRRSEEKYHHLFNSMADGFTLWEIGEADPDGSSTCRLVEVNPAFARMAGRREEALCGRQLNDLLPDAAPTLGPVFANAVRYAQHLHREMFCADLGLFCELNIYSPGTGLLAVIFKDISERKTAEKQREEMQAQLLQAQKLQAVGQLAGGIAHDFNNMLGSLVGFSDLIKLRFSHLNADLNAYVDRIISVVNRMAKLAADLLAFARKGKYHVETINIHTSINSVIDLLEHTLDKRITLQAHLQAHPCHVLGDANQLHNALLNLALNARDAMPAGGTLDFATDIQSLNAGQIERAAMAVTPGTYLRIRVSDTGQGMEPGVRARIFEPFFTTKAAGQGTGLGLASVLGTIENHNGCVTVDSEPGKGSVFTLYLPVVENMPESRPEDTRTPIPRGSASVLIVDDEEAIQISASDMLTQLGYTAHVCTNGIEAIDFYRDHFNTIDLIVLDIIMPRMGGYDCFVQLKQINPHLRVIVCSGYSMDGEARRILDEGAAAFLQKPFSMRKFGTLIHDILKRMP